MNVSEHHTAQRRIAANSAGFSLLEIMVMVAVIGVLAALIYPSLGRVSQLSVQSQCLNNLRAIGAMIPLYAQDNDGRLPGPTPAGLSAKYTRSNINDPRNLCHFFLPYVDPGATSETKFMKIFICPAASKLMTSADDVNDPKSYGTTSTRKDNVQVIATPFGKRDGNSANAANWVQPVKLHSLEKPAETIALMDRQEPSSTSTETAHGTSRNFLFFDGHVRQVPVAKIVSATEILN